MKIVIDIPKEFGEHFNEDRFKDSLERIQIDTRDEFYQDNSASGNYKLELLDMLIVAFEEARIIESSRSSYDPYPSFFTEDYIDLRSTNKEW